MTTDWGAALVFAWVLVLAYPGRAVIRSNFRRRAAEQRECDEHVAELRAMRGES